MNKSMKLNSQDQSRKFLMQDLQVNAFSELSRFVTKKLSLKSKRNTK